MSATTATDTTFSEQYQLQESPPPGIPSERSDKKTGEKSSQGQSIQQASEAVKNATEKAQGDFWDLKSLIKPRVTKAPLEHSGGAIIEKHFRQP